MSRADTRRDVYNYIISLSRAATEEDIENALELPNAAPYVLDLMRAGCIRETDEGGAWEPTHARYRPPPGPAKKPKPSVIGRFIERLATGDVSFSDDDDMRVINWLKVQAAKERADDLMQNPEALL